MKPILLDTFCKAGGAAMGYYKAGFDVVGVDIEPQKNYPFEFIQAEAIEFILNRGHEFSAIHSSPPCQLYSKSTVRQRKQGKVYPDLVAKTREALERTGKHFVIENVPQSPVRPDVILTGNQFNLYVLRKRHFELSFFMLQPFPEMEFRKVGIDICSVFGSASGDRCPVHRFGKKTIREAWAFAMGIDWHMTENELAEAIPPAYTEFIGKQLITLI